MKVTDLKDERVQSKIKVSEERSHNGTPCWEWTGAICDGYGKLARTIQGRTVNYRAHRVTYEDLIGPVPAGLCLDHLCRNRKCVNPAHMEAVTGRENTLRGEGLAAQNAAKTHCLRGHPLSGDNLLTLKSGERRCRICQRERYRKYDAAKRKRRMVD